MGYFADELNILFDNNPYPILLFCCSNKSNTPTELKKLFLETFEISAPDDTQRQLNLKWILEDERLEVDFDLQKVANKTHGFYFEDTKALVYYAKKNSMEKKGDEVLKEEHFNEAIG